MMKLNDEQNLAFMNDYRRIEAQKRLNNIVSRIQVDVTSNGNAMYYLTVLPPLLKELERAYEDLSVVEATIIAEFAEKI